MIPEKDVNTVKAVKKALKNNKLIALVLLTAVLVLSLMLNSTVSYLIAEKDKPNVFELGDVHLMLKEDDFPKEPSDRVLAPGSVVAKNPYIVNIGSKNEYVFMSVRVPLEKVYLVDENNHLDDSEEADWCEIFHLLSTDERALTVSDYAGFTVQDTGTFTYAPDWALLHARENLTDHTHTYIFGYRKMLKTTDDAKTTDRLFDKLQLRNVLEGELPKGAEELILVQAYGIQAEDYLDNITLADPENLTADELKSIFAVYEKQEAAS